MRAIVGNCMPVALSPREMKKASTCNDADLSQVKGCVRPDVFTLGDLSRVISSSK